MENQIRLGIIGLGNMGYIHTKQIAGGLVPEMKISAAADLQEDKRKRAAELLSPDTPIYSDGKELLKYKGIDAVLIAVPHYQHPPLVIEAIKNGLHVMCEKPAGVYTKQVREMNEFADSHRDIVFGMMFNQRTNCVFRKMHEIVKSGGFGAIKRINWIVTDWYRPQVYYDSGNWRATWNGEGGGVLLNQCPHNLDLLQWICGMPNKVRAFCHNGKWHKIEVEDNVTAYMEYPNGATGVFITSTADAPGTNRFEVMMEKGKIICDNAETLTLYRLDVNEREFCKTSQDSFKSPSFTVEQVSTDKKNEQHIGVLKAFASRILRGSQLIAEGQEGINGLLLSNAMHLSSWLDKTIDIPFDEDVFLSELNKRRHLLNN